MKKLSKEQILILHSELIKELYETILKVADGSLEFEDFLQWVIEHQA